MFKKFLLLLCLLTLPLTHGLFAQSQYPIIPLPTKLTPKEGQFQFTKNTRLILPLADKGLMPVVDFFAAQLRTASGLPLEYFSANSTAIPKGTHVFFIEAPAGKVGPEGYRLTIEPDRIGIVAATPKGYFYGVQTLLQLLPAEAFSPQLVKKADGAAPRWTAPCVQIEDEPRFGYRGLHLDVGRHFFPVPFIKKYIDLIALHKLNTFHWHLTEDQGWRIEIKKYPKLTEIGSKRKETIIGHASRNNKAYTGKYDGQEYGGFYTQDEIKDVVRYAQSRFVTIIPEIELPGHALGALAAYPELGCNPDKIYQVATTWGVFEDVFCPREVTFNFLEDVLTEVMELFPSEYIHIGGDECPKKQWQESRFCQELMKKQGLKDEHELQSYFIQRIEKFINAKGRKLIGWDEILEGGLSPNATVMSWRGIEGGIAAARQNHDAVMTPGSHVYLDHYQTDPQNEPLAIGGYTPLAKIYGYEPIPASLKPAEAKHILGTQANVWTEYIKSSDHVEYMVFPRACALAEVAWSLKECCTYADFVARLNTHFKRLDYLKVKYAKHTDAPLKL
ncbi:MAG: beta-N-acetylhexosaminidase [Cytophagaceae bacterium]|nr:beta-N-acetylhexosaminidase [Cytophagaceae bacterium]